VPRRLLASLALLASFFGSLAAARAEDQGPAQPRLIVLLAIDQLRADRISAEQEGAFGRLVREGRHFTNASLKHAQTDTCPGHVTMLTGRHPSATGITGNSLIDRGGHRMIYCAEDDGIEGRILGRQAAAQPGDGRSPHLLRVDTLGDWLRLMTRKDGQKSKVYSVSPKDRSAIMLGGRRPDGAFWLDKASGRVTTSRYYMARLPSWVRGWNVGYLLSPVPPLWRYEPDDIPTGVHEDDFAGESQEFSRTSPHPVKPMGDSPGSLQAFLASPHADRRTLDFARALVIEEDLGTDDAVDLLAIGLSGTDFIGHRYGPWSQESANALASLDERLGRFLRFLEQRAGKGRLLVVLTADHGVMPLPEAFRAKRSTCPVAGARVSTKGLHAELKKHLDEGFGAGRGRWYMSSKFNLVFGADRARAAGVDVAAVIDAAAAHLGTRPGIARVWRREEIERAAPDDAMAQLYRNSLAEGREPDLVIQPAYGCYFSGYLEGTGHGTPYDYDREVPLVFFGAGVEQGVDDRAAATVDIAPTIAAHIGLRAPAGLDGRVLPLSGDSAQ
jgi:hypothetical protein